MIQSPQKSTCSNSRQAVIWSCLCLIPTVQVGLIIVPMERFAGMIPTILRLPSTMAISISISMGTPLDGTGYNPFPMLPASSQAILGMSITKAGVKENFYKGYFDELKVYSRALDASEIWAEYHKLIRH